MAESVLGFLPNSMLIMGRDPELIYAFSMLSSAVLRESTKVSLWKVLTLVIKQLVLVAKRHRRAPAAGISTELKWLIANVSSSATNSHYCQMHTAHSVHRANVALEKIRQINAFETSPLFSDGEKAALRLAQSFSDEKRRVPQEEIHREVSLYFSEGEILQMTASVSLFGFLDRWNRLLDTELEEAPRQLFEVLLSEAD